MRTNCIVKNETWNNVFFKNCSYLAPLKMFDKQGFIEVWEYYFFLDFGLVSLCFLFKTACIAGVSTIPSSIWIGSATFLLVYALLGFCMPLPFSLLDTCSQAVSTGAATALLDV